MILSLLVIPLVKLGFLTSTDRMKNLHKKNNKLTSFILLIKYSIAMTKKPTQKSSSKKNKQTKMIFLTIHIKTWEIKLKWVKGYFQMQVHTVIKNNKTQKMIFLIK